MNCRAAKLVALSLILAVLSSSFGGQIHAAWPVEPYLETKTSTTDAASYNFGNVTVPAPGGLVIVQVTSSASGSRTFSGISIGGSAATIPASAVAGSTRVVACGYRAVEAGDQNVTVTFAGGNMGRCTAHVYFLPTGTYASATPSHFTTTSPESVTSAPMTLNYQYGGMGIYSVWVVGTAAITWDNAAEKYDEINESVVREATAWRIASGNGIVETPSWTGASTAIAVGVVWTPNSQLLKVLLQSSEHKPLERRLDPLCRAMRPDTLFAVAP